MSEIADLQARLREFAQERDWCQFHTPRNLAMALTGEVGELVSELQWTSDAAVVSDLDRDGLRERIAAEAADVLILLVQFADVCGVDLLAAAHSKIALNAERYPVALARGNAKKYNQF